MAQTVPPLPPDLTILQIAMLVDKANKERSNLDDILLKRLDDSRGTEIALDATKKEIQIHREIETTRREMERNLGELDHQIKALESKREEEKKIYEEKVRVLQRVTLRILDCN